MGQGRPPILAMGWDRSATWTAITDLRGDHPQVNGCGDHLCMWVSLLSDTSLAPALLQVEEKGWARGEENEK